MKKDKQKNQNPQEDREISDRVSKLAKADFELQDAMEDAGMEAKTYGFWGVIYRWQKKRGERPKHQINKKKYIYLAVLTGWMGGHRFYAKHYYVGALYLVFFWTLIPFMMTIIDLMQIIPMQADENGNLMF
ncbi:MAG: TM2 domain-containing protein [Fusicatenibacter sp.]|nr:TM2 domain-containing protein [Lachnospiraceae bacterium]MDY2937298.1 TM2 domain-containing protein [Fusicatenibacter sp.]